tara:strand:- start:1502 stop:3136 length:1635 start_codon:yes stop_codon:yes gene_type:complete
MRANEFTKPTVTESDHMDADQVLQYVKKTHAPDEFNIEYSITDHPAWELKNIPISQLNLDPDGEEQDPYNRTNWVDYDVVNDLIPKIAQVLKAKPIVVDSNGWIIDGNHRAMAAAEAGLTSVPALVPAQQDMAENKAAGINKMFNNLGDPVYANLQRVALLAMQGRQSEAAGRLQTVIKHADPAVQKKIIDAVNNIKPVTINGRVADSSTLDKSKQHNDWITNTFIPWVQSLLGQQGVAEGKITLSTDPNWYGATVDNYQASGPVVNIPANQLVGFEPDDKMNQPKSKANVEKIVAGLKKGDKLPPLLVRKYKKGYQVLDGHHRFWAYKLSGTKSIPVQIVPAKDIEEISKQGVAENFADGKNPVKFTVTTPDGYTHSFQITLAVHGKHVGHFNFVRGADTDDVNNEAEVESRWQGQGYGKLLLMKAIDVANNHGLDFQQDIRGITDAQQNVYDSLENAGLIVTPGDGFWFLTPQGEQELNGLNENFADGKNPGRKGLSKRVGVNTKASVSSLRKTAKNSSGEKQRMSHWLANMKAGRAKAKRK